MALGGKNGGLWRGDSDPPGLASWPGVEAHPHRFGGTEYRIGKREIGHIHGDALVDIPFPTKVRERSWPPAAPSRITCCPRRAG